MNDKITIGIPVYQVEKYVTKCFESVLSQTYDNLEIIAVDDLGSDNSIHFVEQLQRSHPRGNSIRIICHTENKGPSGCRNTVIENANGKYIYFLDSDDYIEPEAISVLYAAAEESQSQITYGSYQCVNTSGKCCKTEGKLPEMKFLKAGEFQKYVCSDLKMHVNITSWNILFLTQFIRDKNLRFTSRNGEDFVFFTDFYPLANRVIFLSCITYNYLIREDSITSRQPRRTIPSAEMDIIFDNFSYVTHNALELAERDFYDAHCAKLMKHKFNVACAYIKHRRQFSTTNKNTYVKLRELMQHPASLRQILAFRRYKGLNLFFLVLSRLPVSIMLYVCRVIGGRRGWA